MFKKIMVTISILSTCVMLTSCGFGTVMAYKFINVLNIDDLGKIINDIGTGDTNNQTSKLVVGTSESIEKQIKKAKSLREYIEEYEEKADGSKYDSQWVDTVFFGYYPQSVKASDTDDMIEWIVLDKDDNRKEAVLLSKRVIDYLPYNVSSENITWEKSTIRKWLNYDMYYFSFGRQDRRKIIPNEVSTTAPQKSLAVGGNDTTDKIYLLSLEEAEKYLKYTELVGLGTVYIDSNGIPLSYWLRNPGNTQNFACYVHQDGILSNIGYFVNFSRGIRPVIKVSYAD